MAAGRLIVLMGVSGAGKTKASNLDLSYLHSVLLNAFSHSGAFSNPVIDEEHSDLRTIGKLLAGAMSCPFLDADDFHSETNKEKMRKGIPLSDEDRSPWLISLCDALSDYISSGKAVICACSALRKQYREILRSADPDYRPGLNRTSKVVRFVLLEVSEEILADRVKRRREEEAHFMPATLLKSQLELLELDDSEGVVRIDGTQSGPEIVRAIQEHIP